MVAVMFCCGAEQIGDVKNGVTNTVNYSSRHSIDINGVGGIEAVSFIFSFVLKHVEFVGDGDPFF